MTTALVALLALTAADAGPRLRLTGPPVWIDSGRRLAFPADDGIGALWYTQDPAGGEPEPLYPEPRYDNAEQVWWSPTGDRLAYLAFDDGDPMIFVWELGAPKARILTATGGIEQPQVAWSPDGRRVAVARAVPGGRMPFELLVTILGGPALHVQTLMPPSHPVWSPDSTRIAFLTRFDDGAEHLSVANLAERRAALCSPHLQVLPGSVAWLPSSKRLTFAGSTNLARGARLYQSRADGLLPAEELAGGGWLGPEPLRYSPDGRWAVWRAGPLTDFARATLYHGPADEPNAGRELFEGRPIAGEPVFSPDGRLLACTHYAGLEPLRAAVLVLTAAGDPPVQQIARDLPVTTPVFAPDSQRLAVLVGPPGEQIVEVVPVEAELLPEPIAGTPTTTPEG